MPDPNQTIERPPRPGGGGGGFIDGVTSPETDLDKTNPPGTGSTIPAPKQPPQSR